MNIKEDERIEIVVGKHCRGYLLVNGQLRYLPIGSTMDMKKGIFYWQPGPGFLGEYRFVFIEKRQNGEFRKKKIKVIIKPK
ncbi:MAG: hypothetical protein GY950_15815 [bacterium]|nr:hypothetical protein [bacterium]